MAAGSAHPVIEVRPLDTTMYWSNSQLASHGRAMVSEEAAMSKDTGVRFGIKAHCVIEFGVRHGGFVFILIIYGCPVTRAEFCKNEFCS